MSIYYTESICKKLCASKDIFMMHIASLVGRASNRID